MLVRFSRKFVKQRNKAPKKIKFAFDERLKVFYKNKFDSRLNNHVLTGGFAGCRSINITGDWRAIYREIGADDRVKIIFFDVFGTHSQLYK